MMQFASTMESRNEPGAYWRSVMKDQPMPKAIHKLIPSTSAPEHSNDKTNCHDDVKTTKSSANNLEDKSDVTFIFRDERSAPDATINYHDDKAAPDATIIYRDDKAAPDTTIIYGDDKFAPDVSIIYGDDVKTTKSYDKDFDATPDVKETYHGDVGPNYQGKKPYAAPRPKISVYSA